MSTVRLEELLAYIAEGRIMDAMHEFYAENVVMEEPMYGRTEGLAANLTREEGFVIERKRLAGLFTGDQRILQRFHFHFVFFQQPQAGADNITGRSIPPGLYLRVNEADEMRP